MEKAMDEETEPIEVRRAMMLRSIEKWKARNSPLPWKQQRDRVVQIVPTTAVREELVARGVLRPAKRAYGPADAKTDRERWMKNAEAMRPRHWRAK